MVPALTATMATVISRSCSSTRTACLIVLLQFPELSDFYAEKKGSVYNVLWVLVFGFATLNILGLVLRRFEPRKSGLSFGEILAIAVVFLSIFLLGLEILNLLHIFPIKLTPR